MPNEEKTEAEKIVDAVKDVLLRYFECHSNGQLSEKYDKNFSAQDAMEEISGLVGRW